MAFAILLKREDSRYATLHSTMGSNYAKPFKYQAWFLDQFGVLHDGKQPYPGAISTLEKLKKYGAKMVVISNSSRRSSVTLEKLKNLGFDSSIFAGAITSGELTHQNLESNYKWRIDTPEPREWIRRGDRGVWFCADSYIGHRRDDSWFASLGRSCIHMTWNERGSISLEGLGLQVVEDVHEASFILAHGTEAIGLCSGATLPMKLEGLEKILEQCAARKIPMVVANPDFVTVEARVLCDMPGKLAAKYEQIGGEVKWMGKPDKIIYNSAMAMVGVEASECIAVGDSLHHDIKGANSAGISSVFITGGIHATELGLGGFGEVADSTSVRDLALRYEAFPTYVLPSFTW